jgi:hypothetical protein
MNPTELFDRHPWARWVAVAVVAVAGLAVWLNAEGTSIQVGEPVTVHGFEHVVTDVTCDDEQCIATLQVTNVSNTARTWHADTTLTDISNRRYEAAGDDQPLDPGKTHVATLTYQVRPGSLAQHLTLIPDPDQEPGPIVRIR